MPRSHTINLREVFADFKEIRNVNDDILKQVIEDVFRKSLKNLYGTSDNFDIIINPERGELEIWQNKEVVPDDEFTDPITQIPLSEAKKEDEDYEVGEVLSVPVDPKAFGRRSILAIKQHFTTKLTELQREALYKKYKEKEGEIISAEVYQVWKNALLLLDDEGNELILPKENMIPGEKFHKGERVRGVVEKVELKNRIPKIIVSRTSPKFLEKLFEQGIPEIEDGIIIIKKIVRRPGVRAKVAVESIDDRIDPVGACVGMRGSRIKGIVKELRNENIDVINYTKNPALFIQRALNPAKIEYIYLYEDEKLAEVFLQPEEVRKAIGQGGWNVKLASELTGYKIETYRILDEDDFTLNEISNRLDPALADWVLDELKSKGLDTAKTFLKYSVEEIAEMTDLEEETVEEIKKIIEEEYRKKLKGEE